MPLTPEQETLKQAALAATPGPWHAPGMGEIHRHDHDSIAQICFNSGDEDDDSCGTDADATYIAAANPAAILAILARLEGCNEDYGSAVDSVAQLQDEVLEVRAQLEAVQAVPDILFDGMAVYEEITRKLGKGHCISAEAVSATLDAVVRLIRAAKAAPGEPGQ